MPPVHGYRADLIFLFKMYKGLSRPPFESLFQLTKQEPEATRWS